MASLGLSLGIGLSLSLSLSRGENWGVVVLKRRRSD